MRCFLSRIWLRLRDESGANQLVILTVALGALLLSPVLFDFASVQYARRTTQTAADAAVMAAAKDYAAALSIRWQGVCAEPSQSVVGRYRAYAQGVQWSAIGYASANAYAIANRARLTRYRNYPNGRFRVVSAIPIPFLEINGAAEKDVNTLVEYGQTFETPARATSAVYLDRCDHWVFPCTIAGEPDVFHVYRFYWRIRLVH